MRYREPQWITPATSDCSVLVFLTWPYLPPRAVSIQSRVMNFITNIDPIHRLDTSTCNLVQRPLDFYIIRIYYVDAWFASSSCLYVCMILHVL